MRGVQPSDESTQANPDTSPVPTEVLVARVIRAHAEGLTTFMVLALLLSFLALAGSMMAENFAQTPTYQGGIYGVMVALTAVVIGAAICGWGLVISLRQPPGIPDAETRESVVQFFQATHRNLHWFSRVILVVIVLGVTATALLWMPGIIGIIIGAVAMSHVWAMCRYTMSRCFIATNQLTPQGSRIIPGLEKMSRNLSQ